MTHKYNMLKKKLKRKTKNKYNFLNNKPPAKLHSWNHLSYFIFFSEMIYKYSYKYLRNICFL